MIVEKQLPKQEGAKLEGSCCTKQTNLHSSLVKSLYEPEALRLFSIVDSYASTLNNKVSAGNTH